MKLYLVQNKRFPEIIHGLAERTEKAAQDTVNRMNDPSDWQVVSVYLLPEYMESLRVYAKLPSLEEEESNQ